MAKIEHTNIIIDDFSIAKRQTNRTYTHILTHIHTDHLKGLHDGWTYGPIYCTEPTKALLLYKFPNIPNIITLPLQTPTEIKMSSTLSVTVTFFDANHCIGGVLVLIEGYMGRVLYTGDMRFDRQIFKKYSYLYPSDKRNQKFQKCSKQIDILYLDNTFLKKKFDFPPKKAVLQMATNYIQQLININKHSRIFIGLDSFGKEEVLVEIAKSFNMYIVVDEQRYELLRQTPLDIELFTTNKREGIVEAVRKDKLYANLKEVPNSIGIILSGWVNHPTYRFNQTIYCLPYSLHSNYEEIHQFVNSIRPTIIYPIVHQFPDQNRLFYAGTQDVTKRDLMFNQKLFQEEKGNYKLQIQELRFLYASPPTEEYKTLNSNVQLQKKIDQQLRPPNISNLFTSEKVTPLNMQLVQRKKYKIANNRDQTEINRIKNQVKLIKKIRKGQKIQVVEDVSGKQFELSDNSKNKSEPISIDDQEQFQIMKDDLVEIDPLYEPINNPKNKSFGSNNKQKKAKNTFQFKNESSSQYQKSIIQNIRNKLESKQPISKPHQAQCKYKSKLMNQNNQNINHQNILEQIDQLVEIQEPLNSPIECQVPKNNPQKPSIDLEMVRKVKILDKKEDILMHLKKTPEQLQIIRKLFGNKKTLNE